MCTTGAILPPRCHRLNSRYWGSSVKALSRRLSCADPNLASRREVKVRSLVSLVVPRLRELGSLCIHLLTRKRLDSFEDVAIVTSGCW